MDKLPSSLKFESCGGGEKLIFYRPAGFSAAMVIFFLLVWGAISVAITVAAIQKNGIIAALWVSIPFFLILSVFAGVLIYLLKSHTKITFSNGAFNYFSGWWKLSREISFKSCDISMVELVAGPFSRDGQIYRNIIIHQKDGKILNLGNWANEQEIQMYIMNFINSKR